MRDLMLGAAMAGALFALCVAGVMNVRRLEARLDAVQAELDKARASARRWEGQARIEAASVKISEARAARVAEAREAAAQTTVEVMNAPDLDAAVAAYVAGLERVRQSGATGLADGEADGGGPGGGG